MGCKAIVRFPGLRLSQPPSRAERPRCFVLDWSTWVGMGELDVALGRDAGTLHPQNSDAGFGLRRSNWLKLGNPISNGADSI